MKPPDDLDRMLSSWLDDPMTPPAPRYLPEVLGHTRRIRQRPPWASLERWIPMTIVLRAPWLLHADHRLLVFGLVLLLALLTLVNLVPYLAGTSPLPTRELRPFRMAWWRSLKTATSSSWTRKSVPSLEGSSAGPRMTWPRCGHPMDAISSSSESAMGKCRC